MQASILNSKLKLLNTYNNKRRKIAKKYNESIKNSKIIKLTYSSGAVYHQYVIMINNRNALIKKLDKNKIQYGLHYPKSINQLAALKNFL